MKCIFGHKWSNWKFVETYSNELGSPDKLVKVCKRCGKKKVYVGFTNIDIVTREKSPYIFID